MDALVPSFLSPRGEATAAPAWLWATGNQVLAIQVAFAQAQATGEDAAEAAAAVLRWVAAEAGGDSASTPARAHLLAEMTRTCSPEAAARAASSVGPARDEPLLPPGSALAVVAAGDARDGSGSGLVLTVRVRRRNDRAPTRRPDERLCGHGTAASLLRGGEVVAALLRRDRPRLACDPLHGHDVEIVGEADLARLRDRFGVGPVHGPSLGLAVAVAFYTLWTGRRAPATHAFTGEVDPAAEGALRDVEALTQKARAVRRERGEAATLMSPRSHGSLAAVLGAIWPDWEEAMRPTVLLLANVGNSDVQWRDDVGRARHLMDRGVMFPHYAPVSRDCWRARAAWLAARMADGAPELEGRLAAPILTPVVECVRQRDAGAGATGGGRPPRLVLFATDTAAPSADDPARDQDTLAAAAVLTSLLASRCDGAPETLVVTAPQSEPDRLLEQYRAHLAALRERLPAAAGCSRDGSDLSVYVGVTGGSPFMNLALTLAALDVFGGAGPVLLYKPATPGRDDEPRPSDVVRVSVPEEIRLGAVLDALRRCAHLRDLAGLARVLPVGLPPSDPLLRLEALARHGRLRLAWRFDEAAGALARLPERLRAPGVKRLQDGPSRTDGTWAAGECWAQARQALADDDLDRFAARMADLARLTRVEALAPWLQCQDEERTPATRRGMSEARVAALDAARPSPALWLEATRGWVEQTTGRNPARDDPFDALWTLVDEDLAVLADASRSTWS